MTSLQAQSKLNGWTTAIQISDAIDSRRHYYNVLAIDTAQKTLQLHGFRKNDLETANKLLTKLEKD